MGQAAVDHAEAAAVGDDCLRHDWLERGLDVLEPSLRGRVVELRKGMPVGQSGIPVAQQLGLALEAGFAGDQVAAAMCIACAEKLLEEAPAARVAVPPSSVVSRTIVSRGMAGRVGASRAGGRLIVATDGSHDKHGHSGWGYLATSGHWGCQAREYRASALDRRGGVVGGSGGLVAELRAAHFALTAIPGPVTIMLDSTGALGFLRAWQAGDTNQMPSGYSLRARTGRTDGKPTLVLLAELVAQRSGELQFAHVKGHAGELLNEAADTFAGLARRWYCKPLRLGQEAMTVKAADIAAAFLRSAGHVL
jgi:ribonuclease HI